MSGWRVLLINAPIAVARLYRTVLRAVLLRASHLCALISSRTKMTAIGLATGFLDGFAGRSAMDSVGSGMTRGLEDKVFALAGVNWGDVGVNEL
jgi:hypothetical protein